MPIDCRASRRATSVAAGLLIVGLAFPAMAQDRLPWLRDNPPQERSYDSGPVGRESLPPLPDSGPEPYSSAPRPGEATYGGADGGYRGRDDSYRPPSQQGNGYGGPRPSYGRDDAYRPPSRYEAPPPAPRYVDPYPAPRSDEPEWRDDGRGDRYRDRHASTQPAYDDREPPPSDGTYSMREIVGAGHGFFGSISQGLASVIEYSFKTQGRPNGYILGEDVGGAFVAGLRYGEGRLYTRDAGTHKVYWQGPSIGYDAGAEGSKVMVLVYNLRDPSDIYERFGGVAGSAYVVGGVGLTFQRRDDIVLAPIRAGIGLRFGANVGYLKYTPRPTWNPF